MRRLRPRREGALVVALLLASPPLAAPEGPSGGAGLAGSWTGWAELTNEWPGHPCRYEGAKDAPSVHLELSPEEGRLQGSVAIDLPPVEGSGCPPLRKRLAITEVVVVDGAVSLSDSGGHEWNLTLRKGGDVLRGLLAWREGGTEAPLAEGFAFPDGTRPGSRLSGEVRLERASAAGSAGAAHGEAVPGAAKAAPAKASLGRHLGNLAAVLGASAVGLAALYGVNQLGQGSSEQGTLTCSPRRCVAGGPSEPCFCEGNVVSGDSCGSTESGVPIGGACAYPTMPCQALLSCNNGICEDQFGRCPF
jgi:hypothetical protein